MINQSPISFVRESGLIKRAASYKKLILQNEPRKHTSFPEFCSEGVGIFNLDEDFIRALDKRGFSFGAGLDKMRKNRIYLSGNSNQRGSEVFESDCWAWDKTKIDNPQLTIYFRLLAAENRRGVVCKPYIGGNYDGGACHIPTINNLVRAIAEHFQDVHPLIKEVVDTNFQPVVFWGDINMAGIKSVLKLFYEAYGLNDKVHSLAQSSLSPFDPNPYESGLALEVYDRPFVPEQEQPRLFEQWKAQLESFRNSLT